MGTEHKPSMLAPRCHLTPQPLPKLSTFPVIAQVSQLLGRPQQLESPEELSSLPNMKQTPWRVNLGKIFTPFLQCFSKSEIKLKYNYSKTDLEDYGLTWRVSSKDPENMGPFLCINESQNTHTHTIAQVCMSLLNMYIKTKQNQNL